MFLLWILLSVFSYVSGQGVLKPFPALNNVLTQSLSRGGEALSSWGRSQGSKLAGEGIKFPKRKAPQKDAPMPHPKAQRTAQAEVSEAPSPKTTFRSNRQRDVSPKVEKFVMPVVATHQSPQSSVDVTPPHRASQHSSTEESLPLKQPSSLTSKQLEEIPTLQSSPISATVTVSQEPEPAAVLAPSKPESEPVPTSTPARVPAPTPVDPIPAPAPTPLVPELTPLPVPAPTPSVPEEEEFRGAPPPPPPPPLPRGTFKPILLKKPTPKAQDSAPAAPGDAPKTSYSFMDELKKKFKRNAPAATAQSSTPTDAPEAEEPQMTDAERMAATRGNVPSTAKLKIWGGRKNGMIGPEHPEYDSWLKKDEAKREAERSQPKATSDKLIKADPAKQKRIQELLKKNRAPNGKPAGIGGLFADIQNKRKEKKDAEPAPQMTGTKRKSTKGGMGHGLTDDVLKTIKLNKTERKIPETPKVEDKTAHGFKAHVLKSHTLKPRKFEIKMAVPAEGSQPKEITKDEAKDLKATPSSDAVPQAPDAEMPDTTKLSLPEAYSPTIKPAAFTTPLQTPIAFSSPMATPLAPTTTEQTPASVARTLNFSTATPKFTRAELRKRAKDRKRAKANAVPGTNEFTPPTQEKLGIFTTPEPLTKPFHVRSFQARLSSKSTAKKFIGAHRLVKTPPQQIPDSLPVNEITLTRLKPVGTPLGTKAPLYFAAKATPYTPPKSERMKASQASTSSTEAASFESGTVLPLTPMGSPLKQQAEPNTSLESKGFPTSNEPVLSPEKESTPILPQAGSPVSTTAPVRKFLNTMLGKKKTKTPVSIPLKDMSSSTTSSAPSDENVRPNGMQSKRQNLKMMAQKRALAFKKREALSRHADD